MIAHISRSSFRGACILSAVGSLPLHIMPVLIASAIMAERVTQAQAGMLAAMYLLGQLLITTVLPLLSVRQLRSSSAIYACVVLVAIISLSVHISGRMLFLNWFSIGICCGLLSYLGSTAAAAVENKSIAYAFRLGVTLLVSGCTMLIFYNIDKFAGFSQLMGSLAVVVTILSMVGLWFYHPTSLTAMKKITISFESVFLDNTRWGLLYLFLFALAQVGFIVFAIDSATHRGIGIGDALWAFALCKIFAAVFLFVRRGKKRKYSNFHSTIFSIPFLLLGCLLVASTETLLLFMLGMLLWETSGNLMSSAFQASIVEINPSVGGMYLTSVLLLGSAIGPLIHGALISANSQEIFYCFVAISVFLPLVWDRHRQMGIGKDKFRTQ